MATSSSLMTIAFAPACRAPEHPVAAYFLSRETPTTLQILATAPHAAVSLPDSLTVCPLSSWLRHLVG